MRHNLTDRAKLIIAIIVFILACGLADSIQYAGA
jgi:hypothetical protein